MQPPIEKSCSYLDNFDLDEGLAAIDTAPPIGRTSRRTYWSVVSSSLIALVLMVTMITRGGIAVAAAIPAGLFVNQTIGTLYINGFAQQLAVSDHNLFTVIHINLLVATQITATIKFDVPGFGPVTIKVFVAKVVIHGLYTKTAIPGVAPPSILNADTLFDSAAIDGLSITIVAP